MTWTGNSVCELIRSAISLFLPTLPIRWKNILSPKNKIFEMSDVDQKIEQAKIIMNENVAGAMWIRRSWRWGWILAIHGSAVFSKNIQDMLPPNTFKNWNFVKPNNYWSVLPNPSRRFFFSWFPVYRILLFFFQEAYRAYFVGVSFVWERRVNL